jgi:hypothetical protein
MAALTLAQLRQQAREAADKPLTLNPHVTESELTTYVNQACQSLHDLIIASNEDYHLTAVEFTLSDANTFTLPANFYKLRGVDLQDGSDWFKVKPFNFAERDRFRETDFAGTYRLWYLLRFTPLVADADEIDDQWAEFVVLMAARKMLRKEESDTREIDEEIAAKRQQIVSMVEKRDVGGPRRIADLRRRVLRTAWPEDAGGEGYAVMHRYKLMQNAVYIVTGGWR